MADNSRTLILIKPDAFERGLTGEILARFERKGLRIAEMRLLHAHEEIAHRHYDEHTEKPFFGELVSFITGGPLVAADRSDQPDRGGTGLDPRRLRARGHLQPGPRLRLR